MKYTFTSNGQPSIQTYTELSKVLEAIAEYIKICAENQHFPSVQIMPLD